MFSFLQLIFKCTIPPIYKLSRMHIFGIQFPKNAQYLENGESYQKSATNKRNAEFNFLTECAIRFDVSTTTMDL